MNNYYSWVPARWSALKQNISKTTTIDKHLCVCVSVPAVTAQRLQCDEN